MLGWLPKGTHHFRKLVKPKEVNTEKCSTLKWSTVRWGSSDPGRCDTTEIMAFFAKERVKQIQIAKYNVL